MGLTTKDVGPFEECFTHIAEDGQQTTWAAARLFDYCVAHPEHAERVKIAVEAHHAQFCIEQRGVEEARLAALVARPEYLSKPILFVELPNGTHLLVDGTHRYVLFFGLKLPEITAYVVPFEVAKAFIVEDAPQVEKDVLMSDKTMQLARALIDLGRPS